MRCIQFRRRRRRTYYYYYSFTATFLLHNINIIDGDFSWVGRTCRTPDRKFPAAVCAWRAPTSHRPLESSTCRELRRCTPPPRPCSSRSQTFRTPPLCSIRTCQPRRRSPPPRTVRRGWFCTAQTSVFQPGHGARETSSVAVWVQLLPSQIRRPTV